MCTPSDVLLYSICRKGYTLYTTVLYPSWSYLSYRTHWTEPEKKKDLSTSSPWNEREGIVQEYTRWPHKATVRRVKIWETAQKEERCKRKVPYTLFMDCTWNPKGCSCSIHVIYPTMGRWSSFRRKKLIIVICVYGNCIPKSQKVIHY